MRLLVLLMPLSPIVTSTVLVCFPKTDLTLWAILYEGKESNGSRNKRDNEILKTILVYMKVGENPRNTNIFLFTIH
jgi:hypothetical protein